jgi:hypothetical protein
MRASTATTPWASISTGLMSISRSCGSSQAISLTRSSSASSCSSAVSPRPLSKRAARARCIRRCARKRLSGGSSTATSASSSTWVPPAPNSSTGPKGSTRLSPTSSSRGRAAPLPWRAIGCTVTPNSPTCGSARRTLASSWP